MRLTIIIAATLIAGCVTTYKGPKSNEIVSLCYAEKRDLYLVGDCFEEKLTKYMPSWRQEKDSYEITMYTDFIRAKGLQVKDGYVSESDAYKEVIAYGSRKAAQAKSEMVKEEQARAARSAAAFTGAAILLNSPAAQPRYQPPAYIPPYPSDTTINIQQGAPYRFYDSRPYK